MIDDIQKKSTAVTINEPQDLKVRPIVEGPKYPTRKLTELIHILLKPFLKHIKSYTRDRIDFSNKFTRIPTKMYTLQLLMYSQFEMKKVRHVL